MDEDEVQSVAVFGRRRVGKTYLVRETFENKFTFQHTGISNNQIEPKYRKAAQLEKFSESLKEAGYTGDTEIGTWNDAFNALKEIIKASNDKKKIVFIDELSWMDTRDSGLISALESFWNGWVTARLERNTQYIPLLSLLME